MMIEDKLLHAMINAEMRGGYQIACEYAKIYCMFVGCKDIPQSPLGTKSIGENNMEWLSYYFKLLGTFGKQITTNLSIIRKQYKEKNYDIPTITQREN